jgi:hypothetical protein
VIPVWRKSSRSGSGGNECVEVAIGPTAVLIRDSKNPDDGVLRVTPRSWLDFLRGVKAGQFDRTGAR